jgi:hypothetical protein
MIRSLLRLLAAVCAASAVGLGPAAAAGQVTDVTVGLVQIGTFPSATGAVSTFGPALQVAVGSAIAPRLHLGAEFTTIAFNRNQPFPAPCPAGPCNTMTYKDEFSGLVGLAASGQFDVDPRGRFFVTVGAGGNELVLQTTRFQAGLSAGAGTSFPLTKRMSGVVKIEWWELLGNMNSPRRFVPLWVGLRL